MLTSAFPRHRLAHLPTPLERMDRLRAALGPSCPTLLVKRDDCTGLGTGGNKTRKLEFLIGDALRNECQAVITFGALQSNHARQTAAAAAKSGLLCDLILIDMVPNRSLAYETNGNVLLDQLFGARLHPVAGEKAGEALQRILGEHASAQRKAHVIPIGGSSAVGSLGYVDAFEELSSQAQSLGHRIDAIMHASSSCGTQAGLVAGAALTGSSTRIMGVNVYKKSGAEIAAEAHKQALETITLLTGTPRDIQDRIHVIDGHVGDGYGIPTDGMREAVLMAAQTEGLLLDPVYSGKAMAALISHVRRGKFTRDQTIAFLHTGGSVALHAYPEAFGNAPE